MERALNAQAKAVDGAKIGLLGVAYKAGTADVRESPAWIGHGDIAARVPALLDLRGVTRARSLASVAFL